MLKQAHLYVKGDVISVGFRAWTKIQAKIIGIHGWVKNSFTKPDVFGPSGGVEMVLQGDEPVMNAMVEAVQKGPPVSRVDNVEIFWQEPKELFEGFEIRK